MRKQRQLTGYPIFSKESFLRDASGIRVSSGSFIVPTMVPLVRDDCARVFRAGNPVVGAGRGRSAAAKVRRRMVAYRPIDEAGLARLDDPGLIDQALAARAAGDEAQAELALKIFAFGLEAPLLAFVRNRMGSHGDAVVEEVTGRALEDSIRSITRLRGTTAEEGRAFVFKIARLRIADFLRKGRFQSNSIDDEGSGGPMDRHAGMAVEDIADAIDTKLLYEQALQGLRPDHREAVELFLISGYSARETAEKVGSRFNRSGNDSMSEQNVNQIVSRFRRDFRARLDGTGRR